jgi:hypothetical protein
VILANIRASKASGWRTGSVNLAAEDPEDTGLPTVTARRLLDRAARLA